jgi:hypothetical protein
MNGWEANGQIASADVPISVNSWNTRFGVAEYVRENFTARGMGMLAGSQLAIARACVDASRRVTYERIVRPKDGK